MNEPEDLDRLIAQRGRAYAPVAILFVVALVFALGSLLAEFAGAFGAPDSRQTASDAYPGLNTFQLILEAPDTEESAQDKDPTGTAPD